MKILNSASKLVFLIMALASVAGLFTRILNAEQFMILASMAFSFYFAAKPVNSAGEITK
jgi:hypothetical protein